jgi:pyruvate/2-oxoglutarate dehydrogenase complex dihydrolipoamide acyltransferase (E2) component
MADAIVMPELGQTVDEGRISEWLVVPGDHVELGQPIFIVETDKANVEVESTEEGVLLEIVVPPGRLVETGTVLAWVGAPGEVV